MIATSLKVGIWYPVFFPIPLPWQQTEFDLNKVLRVNFLCE